MKARTSDLTPDGLGNADPLLVWVLLGHRAGDNAQVLALAGALDCRWHAKKLIWKRNWLNRLPRWTPFYGRSGNVNHLTPQAKNAFQAPWPDIVVSVGWRSVPVARWIAAQCGARLIHIGRPRAPLDYFDLILTTPQYRLPPAQNVVQLNGPLITASVGVRAASIDAWGARLVHLPRPWIAVLVGGDTPTLQFPLSSASAIVAAAHERATSSGGSALFITSPRTPERVANLLRDSIIEPAFFHQWAEDTDNPYTAILALADQFIVTNDSISMTHEAASTGRPLQIFPLAPKEGLAGRVLCAVDSKLRGGRTFISKAYRWMIRSGVIYPPKSPADYFHQLVQDGRATYSESATSIDATSPFLSSTERAVDAVQAIIRPVRQGTSDEA